MRLISPFHDYYDVVQHEGQDLSLIYNRQPFTEEAKIFLPDLEGKDENAPFHYRNWYNTDKFNYRFEDWVIGFCGKVYCVVGIRANGDTTYCYSAQEVEDAILAVANKRTTEWYNGQRKWRGFGSLLNRKALDRHFDRYENEYRNKYIDHFRERGTPIFVSRWNRGNCCRWDQYKQEITYNAPIGQYKFITIFDPYRAFQEIQMFLGGLAQPEKQIPAISDKDMAEIKGFNKWSFRKEPKK